ncbi:MAG: TraR/DksA C4-type zinc finger protein [Phycisphaerales bacterium]
MKKASTKKTARKAGARASTKKSSARSPQAAPKKEATPAAAKSGDDKKPARKGITIVSDRPKKKRPTPKAPTSKFPPTGDRLLGPGSPIRKPLIPSGPSRAAEAARERAATERSDKKIKTPFNKRELDKFRAILLAKRAELFGDMSTMETGALRSESGGLSHTPQHFAEQGSDSYDQSLSLDLAAADRRLIKEIDDALQRIADKTFGVCELTGKPISKTRLEELPWARYSIEAARELERRSGYRA